MIKTLRDAGLHALTIVFCAAFSCAATENAVDRGMTMVAHPEPLSSGAYVDYLIASDRYNPVQKHKVREALRQLNLKVIRWNEDEMARRRKSQWQQALKLGLRQAGLPHATAFGCPSARTWL